METLKVLVNDVDVTNAFWREAGALEIDDSLNQPVTASLAFSGSLLPTAISGGELLTVMTGDKIVFDGVVPVEAGVGNSFLYLDTSGQHEQYRKAVKVSATDYQSVLDFKNLPTRSFYYRSAGEIVKALLAAGPLAGKVDTAKIEDGVLVESYTITGRKFSNVIDELSKMCGFYFSLRTVSVLEGDRSFEAEFRSLSGHPAPFRVDRDAEGYILDSLRFDPRDKPLVNRVTVVGAMEPSDEQQIDVFDCDGSGRFELSRIPFYLKSSRTFDSDFGNTLNEEEVVFTPGAFWSGRVPKEGTQIDVLQWNAPGFITYKTPHRGMNQRCALWQEIILEAESNVIFGLCKTLDDPGVDNIAVGAWFQPDGLITYIRDGESLIPEGNPTWSAGHLYSIRIKQTSAGTWVEMQDNTLGSLHPTRHWLPLQSPGTKAVGSFGVTGGSYAVGDVLRLKIGSTYYADYFVTERDAQAGNTQWLNGALEKWLNGLASFSRDYSCSVDYGTSLTITGATNAAPIEITTAEEHGLTDSSLVDISDVQGVLSANGSAFNIVVTGANTFTLTGTDGTGDGSYVADTGTVWVPLPGLTLYAKVAGENFNFPVTLITNNEQILTMSSPLTGGARAGVDLESLPDTFWMGMIAGAGTGTLTRMALYDPVGVEAKLVRGDPAVLTETDPGRRDALAAAQQEVILTCGGADEVTEDFSCQVTMEGDVAVLSFFADAESLPAAGDQLRITYYYGVPIQVTVDDYTSQWFVRAASKIPGDDGIREATDIDLKDKRFSSESATKYAQRYIAARSGLILQGSVSTHSVGTRKKFPLTGQQLSFDLPAETISRSEVITQVKSKFISGGHWLFSVSFGRLPEEFLLPVEDAAIGTRPEAASYSVTGVSDVLRLSESITFSES
jgi:hypothetical protein